MTNCFAHIPHMYSVGSGSAILTRKTFFVEKIERKKKCSKAYIWLVASGSGQTNLRINLVQKETDAALSVGKGIYGKPKLDILWQTV